MAKVYFRIVDWNKPNTDVNQQTFLTVNTGEDIYGYIERFTKQAEETSKIRVYVFENKKQYDQAFREFYNQR